MSIKILSPLAICIVSYNLFAIYLSYYPYEIGGGFLSPKLPSLNPDLNFYKTSADKLFSGDFFYLIYSVYINQIEFIPGPILPLILKLVNYSPEDPIIYNIIYVQLGAISSGIIVCWLINNGIPIRYALIFPFFPQILINTFTACTDIIFLLFFFKSYYYLSESIKDNFSFANKYKKSLFWGFLAALTRPNGIASIISILIASILSCYKEIFKINKKWILIPFLLFITITLYYLPYGIAYIKASMVIRDEILGIGIFNYINEFSLINILNIFEISFKKLIFLFGIYHSYSNNSFHDMVRLIFSIPLIIGFLKILLSGSLVDRLLVGITLLPCLIGFPAERYILCIYPILYLSGIKYFQTIFHRPIEIR